MKNPNAQIVDFLALAGVASKTVASTGVVYLQSYPVEMGASYSFEYQFASGGAVDVKLDLEQGNELLAAAAEGAANANYVVPEDAAAFDAQVADKLVHIKAYAPAATGYVRLKLTGQGSNAASTAISRARMVIVRPG
jgi:hypothetical protein